MNFYFIILRLSHPVSARNKVEMMSFHYLCFYTILLKFSKPGWVGMGSKRSFFFLILGLSHTVLARNKARMMFFKFLNFFAIFFGIFLPGSCTNGIRD